MFSGRQPLAVAHSTEVTTMNKRVLIPLVLASVMLVSATAFAVTDAELQACFKAHSQLMEKPALRNLYTCWRVHGYLMKRHQ
ncbi:conserved hypothetical protein, secreted [mine drainage metagenome]|uniref:Uncharacterized protein n=1 Tax=mine drainage metagenome TaxID=410659 RepID=T1B4W7_9ZZZZ